MNDTDEVEARLISILARKFANNVNNMQIPPPVFQSMQGKVLEFNEEKGLLKAKFPVLNEHLNPFGNMQGGMIAAAIDNTLGPLSMLVAPPNYTRNFEVKYRKPVKQDAGYLVVTGSLIEQRKRQLFFTASVIDSLGVELATAKSTHWILHDG